MTPIWRRIVDLSLFLVVSVAFAGAQNSPRQLTLRDTVDLALKQNVDVRVHRVNVDQRSQVLLCSAVQRQRALVQGGPGQRSG